MTALASRACLSVSTNLSSCVEGILKILATIPTIGAVPLHQVLGTRDALRSAGISAKVFSNAHSVSKALAAASEDYLTVESNSGFGATVTLAAGAQQWEWLLIVNDDIQVDSDGARAIVRELERQDPSTVPALVAFGESELRHIPGGLDVFLNLSLLGKIGKLSTWRMSHGPNGEYPSFEIVAVSARLWEVLGGFAHDIDFTYEDADFVRRAKQVEGYRQLAVPVSGIASEHSRSSIVYAKSVLPVSANSAVSYLTRWGYTRRWSCIIVVVALLFRVPLSVASRGGLKKTLQGVALFISYVRTGIPPELPAYDEL